MHARAHARTPVEHMAASPADLFNYGAALALNALKLASESIAFELTPAL